MRIAIFGLGYVGSVAAACLAQDGHEVIGIDPNLEKVELINSGRAPVFEPGLDDLIKAQSVKGRLRATKDSNEAVATSEVGLICVGTPSLDDGSLDLTYIEAVAREIGSALREKQDFYTVVLRSTVLPGTTRNVLIPMLEKSSGRRFPDEFSVCFNPEFLREGVSIADYYNPPRIVTGTESGKPHDVIEELYSRIGGERFAVEFEVAEFAKYVDNAWHALKVVFANEIGRVSKSIGADSREVMRIMTSDRKLNISPRYLRPAFAYGGSCLPKDVSALGRFAEELGVTLPTIHSIQPSNETHIDMAVDAIVSLGHKKIGLLGLTFKAGTDDLRNSPLIALMNRIKARGFEMRVSDPAVNLANLLGSNLEFLRRHAPGIEHILLDEPHQVVKWADVVVVGQTEPTLVDSLRYLSPHQHLVDLVGVPEPVEGRYVGLLW